MSTQPPEGAPPTDPPKDPGTEEGRIQSLDARFKAQDEKIGAVGDKVQSLIDLVSGKSGGTGNTGTAQPPAPEAGGKSIADQVAEGVNMIEQRRRKEEADKTEKDWRAGVDRHMAEHAPVEPDETRKSRLQRFLFGKEPANRK